MVEVERLLYSQLLPRQHARRPVQLAKPSLLQCLTALLLEGSPRIQRLILRVLRVSAPK